MRGVFAELSSDKQARFTAIANAADERRQQRIELRAPTLAHTVSNSHRSNLNRKITKTKTSPFYRIKQGLADAYRWSTQKDLTALFH